jgi:transposase-like protein
MSQHFLLSAAARTLSLKSVCRMSDEEAHAALVAIRWSDNGGKPYCPKCGCVEFSAITTRKLWKCKGCTHQYSVTSGTIFASRKMQVRDYLLAVAIFVNGAKGVSALQLSRDLQVQYKTAFVLAHKLREAMGAEMNGATVSGSVEVDGAYFGGYVKPSNEKANRLDRRMTENMRGKRQVVIVMRERGGKTLTFVTKSESEGVKTIAHTATPGSVIYADEASVYDRLAARFQTRRINHSERYAQGDARTNMAESFFSRLRRAEVGTHHRIAGPYLHRYAAEMAWRENHRRVANGAQYLMATSAAITSPVSAQWKGYWQRGKNAK